MSRCSFLSPCARVRRPASLPFSFSASVTHPHPRGVVGSSERGRGTTPRVQNVATSRTSYDQPWCLTGRGVPSRRQLVYKFWTQHNQQRWPTTRRIPPFYCLASKHRPTGPLRAVRIVHHFIFRLQVRASAPTTQ